MQPYVVSRVHLIDDGWLYRNSRLHPLPPALKTRCFTPCKLRCDVVLESTLSGTQRSGPTHGERLETSLPNPWREAFILTV